MEGSLIKGNDSKAVLRIAGKLLADGRSLGVSWVRLAGASSGSGGAIYTISADGKTLTCNWWTGTRERAQNAGSWVATRGDDRPAEETPTPSRPPQNPDPPSPQPSPLHAPAESESPSRPGSDRTPGNSPADPNRLPPGPAEENQRLGELPADEALKRPETDPLRGPSGARPQGGNPGEDKKKSSGAVGIQDSRRFPMRGFFERRETMAGTIIDLRTGTRRPPLERSCRQALFPIRARETQCGLECRSQRVGSVGRRRRTQHGVAPTGPRRGGRAAWRGEEVGCRISHAGRQDP